MSKNKVIKSVGFNTTNETDAQLLKYVSRRNFSGFVKHLICNHMEQQKSPENGSQGQNRDRFEQLREQINRQKY